MTNMLRLSFAQSLAKFHSDHFTLYPCRIPSIYTTTASYPPEKESIISTLSKLLRQA